MSKQSLYLITGNAKKLEEFKQILGDQFDFKNQNIDLPEIQGDPQQVAKQKVKIAYQRAQKPVLTQDTSLCFNSYKGLPGPYIKWFLKAVGCEGLAKMVQPFEDKSAYAMCILAYMGPELKQPVLFVGKTPGKIVEPRGSRDFGWDPVFEPDGYDKTYAELPKQIKNTISHRFRAINQMKTYFQNNKSEMKDQSAQKKEEKREEAVEKKQQKAEKTQQKHVDKKQQKHQKKQQRTAKKEEKPKKQDKSHNNKEEKSSKKQEVHEKRQTRSGSKTAKKQDQKQAQKQQKQKPSAKKSKGK